MNFIFYGLALFILAVLIYALVILVKELFKAPFAMEDEELNHDKF